MDSIVYVGKQDNESSADIFHCLADGLRPVLKIAVDAVDCIWVGPLTDNSHDMQMTKGTVHRHPTDEADAILANALELPVTDICLDAIVNYIVPRTATMMARVYCPNGNV